MRSNRLARIGIFAICLSGIVAGSLGCSALRKQMPRHRMAREYTPPAPQPVVNAPTVEADAFTAPALANLPANVQAAFLRDHPTAVVTNVEHVPSGAGPILYRVSAMQDGVPTVSSYRSTGDDLSPRESVTYRDDTGRPRAKYAPVREGGVPDAGTPSGTVD